MIAPAMIVGAILVRVEHAERKTLIRDRLHEPDQNAMDALLADYAAGNLPRALHALVGAHLELKPENRGYVGALESALGQQIEGVLTLKQAERREQRLAAIFAESPERIRRDEPAGRQDPKSLRHFFGSTIDALPCKTVIPGVQEYRIDCEDGMRAVLYRIRGGKAMPQHTHEGSEITLVIRGAFADASGRYACGDIAINDDEDDHIPIAEAGEECVCFAVLDAPVTLTGPIGRWFNRFVKH